MLRFRVIEGLHAVCRLAPQQVLQPPASGFWCELRNAVGLTVYCREDAIPRGAQVERGWALLELDGSFDFAVVGVMARWTRPLAEAGIPIMALSSFETDYLLLKQERLDSALAALAAAGFALLP